MNDERMKEIRKRIFNIDFKSKTKKITLVFIALFTLLTSLGSVLLNVKADYAVNITNLEHTGYTHSGQVANAQGGVTWFNSQPIERIYLSDGRVGFCIEPSMLVNNRNGYTASEINDEIITKIVFHGYLNTGQSPYDYAVTQLMIWETKGYYPTSTVPNYAQRKAQIQSLINTHNTKPSFNGGSYEVNLGDSLTLTDTNNVISQFSNWSATGCDVKVNGNQLTITPSINTPDTISLSANKYNQIYIGVSYIYRLAGSQTIMSNNLSDPIFLRINLKVNKFGSLEITKNDEENTLVPNTTYRLSYNADMSDPIGDYTTGADGKVKIDELRAYATVYYQEVNVPNNLIIDDTIASATIIPNTTISVSQTNDIQKGIIKLEKIDKDTGSKPQGNATLENARYGLFTREDIVNPINNQVIIAKDTLIAERYTNGNGQMSDITNLYLGKYYVKELSASNGYELNEEKINVDLTYGGQTIKVVTQSVISKETVITGNISISKGIADSDNSEILKPEKNAEFITILKKYVDQYGSIETAYEHRNEFSDKEYDKLITNSKGYAKSKDLAYGTYVTKQIKGTVDTNILETTWETVIDGSEKEIHYLIKNQIFTPYLKLVKVDSETNERVTFSSTTFKVWDYANNKYLTQKVGDKKVSEFKTENGYVVLPLKVKPGQYRLDEVESPNGYTINKNGVDFTVTKSNISETDEDNEPVITITMSNDRVKGKISIDKIGEMLTGIETDKNENIDFVYEEKGLPNTEYKLCASDDIISSIDGSILFEKDEIVKIDKTNKDGKLVFDNLELGNYYVQETNASDGFVLDETKHEVSLTYKDNETSIVSKKVSLENERQKLDISVFKKDSMTDKGLADVTLATYLKEDLYSYDGTLLLEKGMKIESRMSNKNGLVNFKSDYPLIELEVKELETIKGYHLSDEILNIDGRYQGQDIKKIEIEKDFYNDIIQSKGKLVWNKTGYVFTHTDTLQTELGVINAPVYEKQDILGAQIDVYSAEDIVLRNGVVVVKKDTLVSTLNSNFDNVESLELFAGNYYYVESETPINFVTDDEKHYFTIKDSWTTDLTYTKETLHNDNPQIAIEFTKELEQDSNTTGKEYQDVVYGLFTRDDTYDYMGHVAMEPNTLISTMGIDENGKLTNFPILLPVGNYYLKELATNSAYVLDDTEHDFSVYQTNNKEVKIIINNEKPVINQLTDFSIRLHKVDEETNKPIINNEFKFERYADKECTDLIDSGTVDLNNGTQTFSNVHYGITYIKEVQAPSEYQLSKKLIKLEVNDKGVFIDDKKVESEDEIYNFSFTNKKIPVIKTNDTSDKDLYTVYAGLSLITIIGVLSIHFKKKKSH